MSQGDEHTLEALWLPSVRARHHPANNGTANQRSVGNFEPVSQPYLGLYLETIGSNYQAEPWRVVSSRLSFAVIISVHAKGASRSPLAACCDGLSGLVVSR